jgi:hypothetical protein
VCIFRYSWLCTLGCYRFGSDMPPWIFARDWDEALDKCRKMLGQRGATAGQGKVGKADICCASKDEMLPDGRDQARVKVEAPEQ